jgi:16S rRNA (cytosine967-C5)-methyltransferase
MQVERFVARHADFAVKPFAALWTEAMQGVPAPCAGAFMLLTPARHGTDGFFAAVLERRP